MSEPTVVIVEDDQAEPEGGGDASFAAGVAAATSAQASEDAGEAVVVAEAAAETAGDAVSLAAAADDTAWAARADVEALRGEVAAGLAELRDMMAAREEAIEETHVPAPEPDSTPAVPASEDTSENRHGDETSEPKKYGSRRWFG